MRECGALGQIGHLVETSVDEGFYTEDSSVITLSQLTMDGLQCLGIKFQKVG